VSGYLTFKTKKESDLPFFSSKKEVKRISIKVKPPLVRSSTPIKKPSNQGCKNGVYEDQILMLLSNLFLNKQAAI